MLDFSKLLTTLADEVKKKPNQKPEGQPLPSESAIAEIGQGMSPTFAADYMPSRQGELEQTATTQGIADEPANQAIAQGEVPSTLIARHGAKYGQVAPPFNDPAEKGLREVGGHYYGSSNSEVPKIQTMGGTEATPQDESTVDWSQTANVPVDANAQARQLVEKPIDPLDAKIATGQQKVLAAQDEPIKKQSFWKDFGAKLIQGADAFFNGNRAPIVGWGKLKHDQAVQRAEGELNPLLKMKEQNQAIALKDAQAGKYKTDAENQIRDDNDRFIQSIRKRKYYNPAEASAAEKAKLASMGYKPEDLGKWDDRDPKTVKWGDSVWQYDPEKKAWVESGIAKDPTLKPEVYEVDETDADGKVIRDANNNPVTRKFVTTSKGAASLKEYANSRKASLRLGQDRLTETKRGAQVREKLAQQQFDFAKSKWNDTMMMRAEAQTRKDAATAAGDIEGAKKADLDLQKAENQLTNWRVNWKTKIGTGGFTQEDYDELVGEQ